RARRACVGLRRRALLGACLAGRLLPGPPPPRPADPRLARAPGEDVLGGDGTLARREPAGPDALEIRRTARPLDPLSQRAGRSSRSGRRERLLPLLVRRQPLCGLLHGRWKAEARRRLG